MVAKLQNGLLVPCPKNGTDGNGILHTNLLRFYENHTDTAAEDGYYPVRYTDKPDGDYLPSWELRGSEIVQVWTTYTPEQELEDPVASRLDMIEECLLELSEVIYA